MKAYTDIEQSKRKELIDIVKKSPITFAFEDKNKVLAWLEKQGEPTDINPSEFNLRLNKLLKQFESLPKEELANSLSFYLNVVQNDGTYKPDEKQGEQKSAEWSEEDEKRVHRISNFIWKNRKGDTDEIYQQEQDVNWIKSLKGRVQPKQEWGEEDEEMLENIIDDYDDVEEHNLCDDIGKIMWLKSLKERVQPKQEWKQENTCDLTDFENAIMHIGDSFFGQHAGLDPNDTSAIKEQANLLLELVPKQEWSEEDEDYYDAIITKEVPQAN